MQTCKHCCGPHHYMPSSCLWHKNSAHESDNTENMKLKIWQTVTCFKTKSLVYEAEIVKRAKQKIATVENHWTVPLLRRCEFGASKFTLRTASSLPTTSLKHITPTTTIGTYRKALQNYSLSKVCVLSCFGYTESVRFPWQPLSPEIAMSPRQPKFRSTQWERVTTAQCLVGTTLLLLVVLVAATATCNNNAKRLKT